MLGLHVIEKQNEKALDNGMCLTIQGSPNMQYHTNIK